MLISNTEAYVKHLIESNLTHSSSRMVPYGVVLVTGFGHDFSQIENYCTLEFSSAFFHHYAPMTLNFGSVVCVSSTQ
jgi:hypothetical protein